MDNSYPFLMYSGLLDPKHYKKIGSALWLFLWCISSTTKEVERDGVNWGIVLGNKPMKLSDFANIFDVNEKTVRRWLDALEQHDYIKITRAPYGLIISVKNSKKYKERVDKNVHSETDKTKMSNPDRTKMSNLPDKNVQSNKDITKINNITITTNKDAVDLIAQKYADLRTIDEGRPVYPSVKDYDAIAQIIARALPPVQIIELLEQCFNDYKQRNPNGRIKAFSYCAAYIVDHYEKLQAKEEAKKIAKRRIPDGNSSKNDRPSASKPAEPSPSITGGQAGRIKRKKA